MLDVKVKKKKVAVVVMFSEPVTLKFIFETIGVIFILVAVGVFMVKTSKRRMD